MDQIIDRINRLSKIDSKNLLETCIKIQEEVGELSAELLKLRGKKGSNGQLKFQIEQNILEECCDVIIMTHSLLNKLKFNRTKIKKALNKKMDKAEINVKKQKLWKNKLK
jgi:NTP pyrophosphatase (non-canonical NTP hydrolase)